MPTPFYHLSLARVILAHPQLPEHIRTFLHGEEGAFYLGKTAPDVQTISGQSRESTHFFAIPPKNETPAWEVLFQQHPQLGHPDQLPPAQAAFIAGYICHLQADLQWLGNVFFPYFSKSAGWDHFYQRYYLHNVLRAYLDEQIMGDLPQDIYALLGQAQPNGWLPFVADMALEQWRDMLVKQLRFDGQSRTAEVFSERMSIPVEKMTDLLNSEERMEAEIFSRVPRQLLVEYRHKLIASNLELLSEYFCSLNDS